MNDYRERLLAHVNATPLPDLGDSRKLYETVLSEPELNAIAGVIAFARSACSAAGLTAYWKHYGPILDMLTVRLGREIPDDDNAPYQERA